MRNIFRLLAIFGTLSVLLWPPFNASFSATMPRKVLVEPILLLLCGYSAAQLLPMQRWPFLAAGGVTAGTFLFVFSMIPRSIDLTQIYPSANYLYVISIVLSGYLVSNYLPMLRPVTRVVYVFYFLSMAVAVGLVYTFQSTLWCSAYTLDDQHAFGQMLTGVGIIAYIGVLTALPRWLVRTQDSQ